MSGTFCTVVSDQGGLGFHCSMNSAGSMVAVAALTNILDLPSEEEDEVRNSVPPPPSCALLSRSTITSDEAEDCGDNSTFGTMVRNDFSCLMGDPLLLTSSGDGGSSCGECKE